MDAKKELEEQLDFLKSAQKKAWETEYNVPHACEASKQILEVIKALLLV